MDTSFEILKYIFWTLSGTLPLALKLFQVGGLVPLKYMEDKIRKNHVAQRRLGIEMKE